ncbi:MAG: hypothetical protein H7Y04_04180 [Verrucomicrobia bacterium]|nr:hypothetical protein [Cytophagales bacterium]
MKKLQKLAGVLLAMAWLSACDQRFDEVIEPISATDFPKQLVLSDGGNGDYEDEDNVDIDLELLPQFDPTGKELEGKINTLTADVTVNFEIKDLKGFTRLSDYVKEGKALYEIDDCTTSEDENIDLKFTLDLNTGKGSFIFPKGVEAVSLELEVDEDLFDDEVKNTADRGFTFAVTSITGASEKVVLNTETEFDYEVLDDDVIFGDWEVDVENATEFANFKSLFGSLDEDIAELEAADINKIEISFGYEGVQITVELKETEPDACDATELVNKEIEIEGAYEIDLDDLFNTLKGDMEFAEEIEQDNGSVVEFKFEGKFEIDPTDHEKMKLTLKGEYLDDITEKVLNLKK